MRPGRDPHRVRAGDLAPVHPAQFTQLDVTLGETSRATGPADPGPGAPGSGSPGRPLRAGRLRVGRFGLGGRSSGPQRGAARSTGTATGVPPASAPSSAGPATRRIRIAAGVVPGRKQAMTEVAAASANTGVAGSIRWTAWPPSGPEQQLPDEPAVVHVQPLGRGDEHAQVARDRVARRGQEEMGVQPGQPAGGQPLLPGGAAEPVLPRRGDLMVPHVGRVAQEQRGPSGRAAAGRGGSRRAAPRTGPRTRPRPGWPGR